MTELEVRQLMAAAMAYDNRNPGEANLAAWAEAADRGRWTYEAALEAVHMHYATSTEFLMPGHITAMLKREVRQPARYEALPPAAPASEETRERVLAEIQALADRLAVHDEDDVRRPAPSSEGQEAARAAARAELERLRRERGKS